MDTRVVKVDVHDLDNAALKEAGALIRQGGLVAFPTETVYGLGANGLDAAAVNRIYEAKDRPADNPLILHISRREELDRLVDGVSPTAERLIDRFWPGPLTIIFKKSPLVPDAVTAGLDTVAVRMPSNEVASRIIYYAKVPVAAPSANLSGKPSPTRVGHVLDDLLGRVDMIIDGGDVTVGVESTVAEVVGGDVTVLRPGGITLEDIKTVTDRVAVDPAVQNDSGIGTPKAPGMKYTHYSPAAEVIIIDGELKRVVDKIRHMAVELTGRDKKVGILATKQTEGLYKTGLVICAGDRDKPGTIAAGLFAALRQFDKNGVDIILAEGVGRDDMGLAVMNRLLKAAGYNVIKV